MNKNTARKLMLSCFGVLCIAGAAFAAEDVYAPVMHKMHQDMMIAPTGDADVDFVRGMIPHHQGAVDMAKILLEKGKDPELRKLAEDIVASQEKEIAFMQAWLEKNEKNPAK